MPELPEVETVRRGLAHYITGRKIKNIEILHPRATRSGSTIPLKSVEGARIIEVTRRGKFLWFVLDRDLALVGHLGMSGQMLIVPKKSELEKHARARIDFGDRTHELRFIDQRTFGWMSAEPLVIKNQVTLPECCAHIAPDIFAPDFEKKSVVANISRRKTQIKKALLDQEIMSGVGNIYADEALWYAKVHPERISSSLSENEINEILRAVKKVMKSALKQGGTSFDDLYINVNGESGYFEVSLRAYGREDEPCRRCGTLIRRIIFANRSSHFCPSCQRARKSRKPVKR
jgi:formamidopyrimidine-DNA glycosylase